MNKKELIKALRLRNQGQFSEKTVEFGVNQVLEAIIAGLDNHKRVEIRGFGNFSIRTWGPRYARHPVTGENWRTPSMHAVHFKPGKELKERVNVLLDETAGESN